MSKKPYDDAQGGQSHLFHGDHVGLSLAWSEFALVVKWLVSQMTHRGLEEKQFFYG